MKKTLIFLLIIITILALTGATCSKESKNGVSTKGQNGEQKSDVETDSGNKTQTAASFDFSNPKKSAHYETNAPAHEAVLAAVPINVVVDFNFDLAKPSSISIKKDGKEYGKGDTKIDSGKLSMRKDMDSAAPNGLYLVSYDACWPDGSCHEGFFQFAINKPDKDSYTDLSGKKNVTINMENIAFKPENFRISKGTEITWVNKDDATHFINTDPHPAHTYYLKQNSKALDEGDEYSLTFTMPGVYPYHCSAHASQMTGTIIVE